MNFCPTFCVDLKKKQQQKNSNNNNNIYRQAKKNTHLEVTHHIRSLQYYIENIVKTIFVMGQENSFGDCDNVIEFSSSLDT